MKNKIENFNQIVAQIMGEYGCSEANVLHLIKTTDNMINGCRFAHIKGYRSDKADQTELANHMVILGFSYANMKEADKKILEVFDINTIDVESFNYNRVDIKTKSLDEFKVEVKANLSKALDELKNPKARNVSVGEPSDVYLNDILVFNKNTKRLSIVGKELSKKVTEQGEYKKTASAPKTVAKELIRYNLKSNGYRRFAIDNLNVINIQGETLEIGGV